MKNIYGVCRHVLIKFIKIIFINLIITYMQHIERIYNKTTLIKQISGYQNCKPIKRNC